MSNQFFISKCFINKLIILIKKNLSRVFNELETKMHDIKEYKEKLLVTLGEFLEDHFPLPDRNVKKKKVSCREDILIDIQI